MSLGIGRKGLFLRPFLIGKINRLIFMIENKVELEDKELRKVTGGNIDTNSFSFRVTINDQINNVRVLEYPINVSYDKIVFNLVDAFDSARIGASCVPILLDEHICILNIEYYMQYFFVYDKIIL